MRKLLVASCLLGWLITVPVNAFGLDVITMPPVKAVVIDGDLTDAAWSQAEKVTAFYQWKGETGDQQTEMLTCHDEHFLYFGFTCRNPRLKYLSAKKFPHDGPVFNDESVEVLIRPSGAENRYFHFALSIENTAFETETVGNEVHTYFYGPWRYATKRGADAWTAEIAIPVFIFKTADLSSLSLNVVRNFAEILLDVDDSVLEEKIRPLLLNPNVASAHDLGAFIPVKNLAKVSFSTPFMPRIKWSKLGEVALKYGGLFYDLGLVLDNAEALPGEVKLLIREEQGGQAEVRHSETIMIKERTKLALEIPLADFREKTIKGVLVDPQTGSILFETILGDSSAFKVIKEAFTELNYYSSEPAARIKVTFGIAPRNFGDTVLRVKLKDKVAAEIANPPADSLVEIPLPSLPQGENLLTLVLTSTQGKELGQATVRLSKIEPQPGETKIDRFRGQLIKHGQPFFPIALFTHYVTGADEFMFKALTETGFNTLHRLGGLNQYEWRSGVEDYAAVLENARKYQLQIINMPDISPDLIKDKPFAERLKLQMEVYDKKEQLIRREIEMGRAHPNLLAYYGVDEPNLVNPEIRVKVANRFFDTVSQHDPHHPIMQLYARYIPPGDQWTQYGEMLGFDIYPRPGWRAPYSRVGEYTLSCLPDLQRRAEAVHQATFFIPILRDGAMVWARMPIPLTDTQTMNQTYLALILGNKGLLYYELDGMAFRWELMKELCGKVREFSPALLNDAVAQELSYAPGTVDTEKKIFPPALMAFFKYPADDSYLLLMANARDYAVGTSLQIAGVKATELLHSSLSATTPDNLATDKLEPCGVRAWKLRFATPPATIKAALKLEEFRVEKLQIVNLPLYTGQLRQAHNCFPNPCFAHQTIKGLPDFFSPSKIKDPAAGQPGSTWYLDEAETWQGKPSLKMTNTKPFPAFGVPNTSNTNTLFYPPQAAREMTFSFYAKAAKEGDQLFIVLLGVDRKTFTLTTEWTRYSFTFQTDGSEQIRVIIKPPELSSAWFNGFQAETGGVATEFEDNSDYVY
jgi:hypothetical protein